MTDEHHRRNEEALEKVIKSIMNADAALTKEIERRTPTRPYFLLGVGFALWGIGLFLLGRSGVTPQAPCPEAISVIKYYPVQEVKALTPPIHWRWPSWDATPIVAQTVEQTPAAQAIEKVAPQHVRHMRKHRYYWRRW